MALTGAPTIARQPTLSTAASAGHARLRTTLAAVAPGRQSLAGHASPAALTILAGGKAIALLPPGGVNDVVVVDARGRHIGLNRVEDLHAARAPYGPIAALARAGDIFLLPGTPLREALDLYADAGMRALAVLDAPEGRRVVGRLSEVEALRLYGRVLEGRVREHADA